MAHVLIGFAEALPAPEVVFSLLSAGHQVSAFCRDASLPLAALPLSGLHRITAPEQDTTQAIADLTRLLNEPDAPELILPMDDAALWLVNTSDHKFTGRIAGATGTQAKIALDKIAQIEAARAAGLSVPETLVLPGDVGDVPRPAIAKPANAVAVVEGRLGRGDATYLADQNVPLPAGESTAPLLVQPLIKGQGEGVFGFATDNGITAWSAHRRLRMMNPHGSGASACISQIPDADLKAKITAFIEAIDWRGAFMIELLRDANDTLWFMELNGRMWGSMALARRQGLEYPAWAVAQRLDPTFHPDAPEPPTAPLTLRHLGREMLHLAFVARGAKSTFHRDGWPSLLTSASGVLRPAPARLFYNHDPAFPRYFLKDAVWTLRKALSR